MLIPRRRFLQASAGLSALALPAPAIHLHRRPSDELRAAVIGLRGRGGNLLNSLRALEGVQVTTLCDVDDDVLQKRQAKLAEAGEQVDVVRDMRRLFDRHDIDVVAMATPNHWHALGTVWACQSGKDVYVEKPVSHCVHEGRQMIRAARRYDRIVQAGTQCRSSSGLQAAVAWVRAGNLGAIQLARGLCYKPRKSIGRVAGPQPIPAQVDYDLWCGPAPVVPLMRQRLHYDWHWDATTGDGDLGNQGIHQVDICRWFLGESGLAPRVVAVGGRFGYADDANTPNTLITAHEYESAPLVFEVRGLPESKAAQTEDWGGRMDRYRGVRIGCVIECEGGSVVVFSYSKAIAYDGEGNELQVFEGGGDHMANFIEAVRSREPGDLTGEITEGHVSSALCHLSNLSYWSGHATSPGDIAVELEGTALSGAFERMQSHLASNEVDLMQQRPVLGRRLEIDPERESITGPGWLQAGLRLPGRPGFSIPERV